ncbi:hypothetical protein ACFX1S_032226 [Malus domestica]
MYEHSSIIAREATIPAGTVGYVASVRLFRLMRQFDMVEMERMLMTGLACVHPNHVKRPMVKEAARIRKGEKPLPLLPPRKPRLRHRPPCIVVIILRAASTFFPPTHQTVSLSLSPTSLSKSGDSVLIQWSGIDSPSRLNWLDIYSSPSSHHDNFIGYKFLSSAPTWKSGSGSISFPLVNLRFNYSFPIFCWNESEVDPNHLDQDHNPFPGTTHLLATSDDELSFESSRVPDQIHLAYTD